MSVSNSLYASESKFVDTVTDVCKTHTLMYMQAFLFSTMTTHIREKFGQFCVEIIILLHVYKKAKSSSGVTDLNQCFD